MRRSVVGAETRVEAGAVKATGDDESATIELV